MKLNLCRNDGTKNPTFLIRTFKDKEVLEIRKFRDTTGKVIIEKKCQDGEKNRKQWILISESLNYQESDDNPGEDELVLTYIVDEVT